MTEARLERLLPASGVVFVVLTVAAYALVGPYPAADDSSSAIAEFYSERTRVLTSLVLNGLALPFFVGFLGVLRAVLRRAEGETGALSAIAVIAGSVVAALAVLEATIHATLAFREPDPGIVRALFDLAGVLFVFASFALAAFLAGASAAMILTGAISRAIGWAGLAVTAIELVAGAALAESGAMSPTGVVPITAFILFLAWILAASVAMLRRAR